MVHRSIKAQHAVTYTGYSHLKDHIQAITSLPFALRKDLLVITRCQLHPERSKRLRSQLSMGKTKKQPYPLITLKFSKRRVKPGTVVSEIAERCEHNPVFSGFISMLTRTLPILDPNFQAEQERLQSMMKEFSASQRGGREQVLNYSVWFSSDSQDVHLPLSRFLPPCPGINDRIRSTFQQLKGAISKMSILLPQVNGKRSVSRSTASLFARSFEPELPWDKEVLPRDLERRYADSGVKIQGYAELRQVWTFGDLKPRTYFAFGGKTFHASKYIRPVANLIANAFPETGFVSRWSYHDVVLTPKRRLFTYDYATFTSNLSEHRYFLFALSDFLRGTVIEILDSYHGIELMDVGEMLYEYTRITTDQPEFTVNRLFEEEEFQPYIHLVAGFLGVYGNISTATTLHGLHAAQICGEGTSSKCVGDDVLASGDQDSVQEFSDTLRAIQSIGEIEQSKVQVWEDDAMEVRDMDVDSGWHYTKRPIDRVGNNIAMGILLEFPMFGALCPVPDGVHEGADELKDRIAAAASQVFQMVRRCRETIRDDLQEEDIEFILQSIRPVYAAFGVPETGLLPTQVLHGYKGNLFLPIDREIFFDDWKSLKIGLFDDMQPNSIPVTVGIGREKLDRFLEREMEYTSRVGRFHSFMEHMGYLEVAPIFEPRIMTYAEYIRFVESLLVGDLVFLYRVTVVEVPHWCHDLQSRLQLPYDD